MGAWGTGLYSNDFAKDLRGAIGAILRLPFSDERLLDILCESQARAANEPGHEEHTLFWLVVADQFAKRGVLCERARSKALAIVDDGSDVAMMKKLGMSPLDLRKREKMLGELRSRLEEPLRAPERRRVLKKPQAYLIEIGDVLVYPTARGCCINPYLASTEQQSVGWSQQTRTAIPWTQDGWGAMVLIDRGRAFDFLAWYRPLTISMARPEKPSPESLLDGVFWVLRGPGTLTPIHFKRMRLAKAGSLPLDHEKIARAFPWLGPGTRAAIDDISMANDLDIGPQHPMGSISTPGQTRLPISPRPYVAISGLRRILGG